MDNYVNNLITKFKNKEKLTQQDFSDNQHYKFIDFVFEQNCSSYYKQLYNYVHTYSDQLGLTYLKTIRINYVLNRIEESIFSEDINREKHCAWYNYMIPFNDISPSTLIEPNPMSAELVPLFTYFAFKEHQFNSETYLYLKWHPDFDLKELMLNKTFSNSILDFHNKDIILMLKEQDFKLNNLTSLDFENIDNDFLVFILESNAFEIKEDAFTNLFFEKLIISDNIGNLIAENNMQDASFMSVYLKEYYLKKLKDQDLKLTDSRFYEKSLTPLNLDVIKKNPNLIIIPSLIDHRGSYKEKKKLLIEYNNFLSKHNLCLSWEHFQKNFINTPLPDRDDWTDLNYEKEIYKNIIINNEQSLLKDIIQNNNTSHNVKKRL